MATDFMQDSAGRALDGKDEPQATPDGMAKAGLVVLQPGIQLRESSASRDFGSRMHQLLHERRLVGLGLRPAGPTSNAASGQSGAGRSGNAGAAAEVAQADVGFFQPAPEWPDEDIESECQATLAAYEAHYVRDYEYLESERTHCIPLPREYSSTGTEHELCVKLDAVVRHPDGTIGPFDTKTESKPGYNTYEDWAGRTQGKIYLWALKALYPDEEVSRLVIDVVTRRSAKQQRGPVFNRLDDISCAPQALEEGIRNVVWVADDIVRSVHTEFWRSNMNVCKRGWEKCEYFPLHVYGRTPANMKLFKPAEQYLDT